MKYSMMQTSIYLLIILIPFQIYFNFYRNLSVSVAEIFAIIVFVAVVLGCVRRKEKIGKIDIIAWPILAFIIAMIASIPLSDHLFQSVKYFIKWASMMLLFFAVSRTANSIIVIKRAILCFIGVATIVSLLGIIEYSIGYPTVYSWVKTSAIMPFIIEPNTLRYKSSTDTFNYVVHNWADMSKSGIRAFGTFECAIEFSAYLGLVVPFLGWLVQRKKRNYLFALIAIVSMLMAIILNFTRSAYLSLFVVGILDVFYIYRNNKHNILRNTLLIVSISILLLAGAFTSSGFRLTLKHRIYQTLPVEASRPHLWNNALTIIASNPFMGVGIANYQGGLDKYCKSKFVSLPAHNQYLQVAAEMGFIGLFTYLAIIVICMYCSCRMIRESENEEIRLLALGFLGMWIWFDIQSFFDVYLFGDKFTMMFWIMVGLNASLYKIYQNENIKISD